MECLCIEMQDFKDSELEWTLAELTTLATWKNQLLHVSITDLIKGKPFYQKETLNLDKRLQVVLHTDVKLCHFFTHHSPVASHVVQSI